MASSLRGNELQERKTQDFDFAAKNTVVIGYRLAKISFSANE